MASAAEHLAGRLQVDHIRQQFPLLQQAAASGGLHYLDNAATTQKPQPVLDAMQRCYTEFYSPVHRGLYPLAEQATDHYESARQQLATFIGAGTDDIIFTRSATESINLVAQGWAAEQVKAGDVVWVSRMEHHANYLPWQRLCQQRGAELRVIELQADGQLDLESCPDLYDRRTRLIALTQVSNVLGIENPIRQICAEAHLHDIPVLVDAAQAVAHLAIDVEQLGCDFLTFSAHKMYGPAGIGLLYARQQRQQEMQPMLLGGGMVDQVAEANASSSWIDGPGRFEAGTPDLPAAVGFAAAASYLQDFDRDTVQQHLVELARKTRHDLQQIAGVTVLSATATGPIVSFVVDGIHPHDIAHIAGEQGVAIRAGHHCAQPLLRSLDLVSTARASFAVYNDFDDVDGLLESVDRAQRLFL